MKPNEVDMGVSDQDEIVGAIWSRHCASPYHDAVLIDGDILLITADGSVSSGISCQTIQKFAAEA